MERVLYLHGLYSQPNPEKQAALEALGLEVHWPPIDYAQPDIFTELHELALNYRPHYLVGSSMGGYVGYYLAKMLDVPALLFNPAFHFAGEVQPPAVVEGPHTPPVTMVIGAHDDVVHPPRTFAFLVDHPGNYEIWLDHTLGHQIPLAQFALHTGRYFTGRLR